MTEEEARWIEINLEAFTFKFANRCKIHYNKIFNVIDALAPAGEFSAEAVRYAMNEVAYNRAWIRPSKTEAVVLLKQQGKSVRQICNLVQISMSTYYACVQEYENGEVFIKARLTKDVLTECGKFLDFIKEMGGMFYDTDS